MKKYVVYALSIMSLLLLAVACQAETAESTPTIQATASLAPLTQPPAESEPSSSGLRARLETPPALSPGEPVVVQFILTNETENDLYVLNWFTPLEGLGGDIFRVTRDGQRIRYQGPLASRTDPTPEAYTLLEAGGTVEVDVDLSLAYDFSQPGNYTIKFVSPNQSHVAGTEGEMARSVDELGPVEIPSNQVVVTIGG